MLRTGSYTNKDGNKVYTTDVIVSEQYFAEGRNSSENRSSGSDFAPAENRSFGGSNSYSNRGAQQNMPDGFTPIDSDIEGDDDLPF